MTKTNFKFLCPVCYGTDPCLWKIPHQEAQGGQLISYFSCKSSVYCNYQKQIDVNLKLKEESVLEKNVKSE